MSTDVLIPYQVDTVLRGKKIDVHVFLPDTEGAVDYHWYVNLDAAEAQDPDHPIFDIERAAKFFGEEGIGMNRRTVDRVTRAIEFDLSKITRVDPPKPKRKAKPAPAPEPDE